MGVSRIKFAFCLYTMLTYVHCYPLCAVFWPQVEEGHDYCIVQPLAPGAMKSDVAIDTYDDHRMAMCFSLAACAGVPVVINDPGCTAKTFPTYFDVLNGLTERA